ncbi:hypothetical protein D915_004208 [Fasciola hepatica]|uniref:Uncharacterized protein n=1 Tax=Fasciola hepatica TaxID=6192 RepID=A0A4E0REW0_FASHE|nr:hypothetical protein D915_004208 [Fasciola hepatica]
MVAGFVNLFKDRQCDGYYDSPHIIECEDCFFNQESQNCGMTIFTSNGAKMQLVIWVISDRLQPGIKVYDAHRDMTYLTKVVERNGYYVFQATGTAIYIRFPAKEWGCARHKFGLMIHRAKEISKTKLVSGCVNPLKLPATINIPKKRTAKGKSMECAWWLVKTKTETNPIRVRLSRCIPGDETNCYLYYVRIFDGFGENKTQLNKINDTGTTLYSIKSDVVIIEYYGFPAMGEIIMKVDYGTG